MKHEYEVTGLHCADCVNKIGDALRSLPGIESVSVTLQPPRAAIEMHEHISTPALNDAAKRAGSFSLKESSAKTAESTKATPPTENLTPLFIIVGYVLGGTLLKAILTGVFHPGELMTDFMGGFFIMFSLFKMIDLKGFADGYSTYDLLAKRSREYARHYPFIELTLGVLFLTRTALVFANIVTLVLMSIGAVGVLQVLREKRTIQCACLGTALKLPMTKVTLAEDLLMAGMALVMLLM